MEDHEQERKRRRQESLDEYKRIISYQITPPPPSETTDKHKKRKKAGIILFPILILLTAACYFFIGSRLSKADEANRKLQEDLSSYQTRLNTLEEKAVSSSEADSAAYERPSETATDVAKPPPFTAIYPLTGGCMILHPFGAYTTEDGEKAFCLGLDMGTEKGTGVLAAADGTVLSTDEEADTGKTVQIDHGNGYITMYCYNEEIVVTAGETVTAGQHIAVSGIASSDGIARMEFRVTWDGVCIDPETVMDIRG